MNREIRQDLLVGKRLTNAAMLFVGAMIVLGLVVAWIVLSSRSSSVTSGQSIAVLVLVLATFITVVNMFVAYGRLRWFYRCPRCSARVPRVPEAEADGHIRYQCSACSIDWDTGWSEDDVD